MLDFVCVFYPCEKGPRTEKIVETRRKRSYCPEKFHRCSHDCFATECNCRRRLLIIGKISRVENNTLKSHCLIELPLITVYFQFWLFVAVFDWISFCTSFLLFKIFSNLQIVPQNRRAFEGYSKSCGPLTGLTLGAMPQRS